MSDRVRRTSAKFRRRGENSSESCHFFAPENEEVSQASRELAARFHARRTSTAALAETRLFLATLDIGEDRAFRAAVLLGQEESSRSIELDALLQQA